MIFNDSFEMWILFIWKNKRGRGKEREREIVKKQHFEPQISKQTNRKQKNRFVRFFSFHRHRRFLCDIFRSNSVFSTSVTHSFSFDFIIIFLYTHTYTFIHAHAVSMSSNPLYLSIQLSYSVLSMNTWAYTYVYAVWSKNVCLCIWFFTCCFFCLLVFSCFTFTVFTSASISIHISYICCSFQQSLCLHFLCEIHLHLRKVRSEWESENEEIRTTGLSQNERHRTRQRGKRTTDDMNLLILLFLMMVYDDNKVFLACFLFNYRKYSGKREAKEENLLFWRSINNFSLRFFNLTHPQMEPEWK